MFDAYRRFFAFAGKQAGTWKKGLVFEFLRSIFEAFQFIALLIVLRALVEQNVTAATAWVAFGTMAVSVAGAALFWYLAHNSEGQANYRMCGDKRIHIGERMKYMPMGYFNSQSLGALTAAATTTMEEIEGMSFAVIARTVVGIIRTLVFTVAILCLDWRVGIVFLLGALLFLWVNAGLLKKSRQLSPERIHAQTALVDAALEYIQGMSVVRAFRGSRAAEKTMNEAHWADRTKKLQVGTQAYPLQCAGADRPARCGCGGDSAFHLVIPPREHEPVYLPDDDGFRFFGLQRVGVRRRDVFHVAYLAAPGCSRWFSGWRR